MSGAGRKRLDFARAFDVAAMLSARQSALAVETDPKERARLEQRIAVLDDALTPPKKRQAAERAIRARETKRRLKAFLLRWVRRFGPPTNIGAFIRRLETRGWTLVAPPGSKNQPGPSRPHLLSGQTVRELLRSLGVIGRRGRKRIDRQ